LDNEDGQRVSRSRAFSIQFYIIIQLFYIFNLGNGLRIYIYKYLLVLFDKNNFCLFNELLIA